MHAIVSIHDVMPATLANVDRIVARLPVACLDNLILLIVPGADWQREEIDKLRSWQQQGLILAGHGWNHEAREVATFRHRLHSLLLSRNAAEHLALDEHEIAALLERNHRWFGEHGLDAPDLYVPPAWALGAIGKPALRASPWRFFEVLTGVFDVTTGAAKMLPLAGFEADAWHRQIVLTASNWINRWLAGDARPVRIAIHPHDFEYRLTDQLTACLESVTHNVRYDRLFE